MNRAFALTTRGLERVSAQEMAAAPGVVVKEVGYRRVAVEYESAPAQLATMRTVDDVFLHLATWSGIGHRREVLATLAGLGAALPVEHAAAVIADVRPLRSPRAFSVTANFVGKRNYGSDEIRDVVGDAISSTTGWAYERDDRLADLNVRVFIEHERAFVGARIAEGPLHRRAYKVAHIPGSLKPPVAAALLRLGGIRRGMRVFDPCCGAGTIVIEAALMGARACGGDIGQGAVGAARVNANQASVDASFSRWDAMAAPVVDGGVDLVATNLPWGQEVEVGTPLALLYRRICGEIERAVGQAGRAVLLADSVELVLLPSMTLTTSQEISLFGRTPSVMVFSGQGICDDG